MRPSPPSSRRSNLNANPNLLARMHPSDAILTVDLRRSAYEAWAPQARQIGKARNPPNLAVALSRWQGLFGGNPPHSLIVRIAAGLRRTAAICRAANNEGHWIIRKTLVSERCAISSRAPGLRLERSMCRAVCSNWLIHVRSSQ